MRASRYAAYCLLGLLWSVSLSAQVDLTGRWRGSWRSSFIGGGSLDVTLTQSGTTVTGTVTVGGSDLISSGTVRGTISGSTVTLGSVFASGITVDYRADIVGNSALRGTYVLRVSGFATDNGTFSLDRTGPVPPAIASGGIVNGASFQGGPLVPGSIVSVFGTNLATTAAQASAVPLPKVLLGTTAMFNGVPAPLYFVSPTQLNVQVPWDLSGSTVRVEVVNNGVVSPSVTMPLGAAAPGIFVVRVGSRSVAAVLHNSTGTLVTPEDPAMPGEILQVFATGLGAVTPPVTSGTAALGDPLSASVVAPKVRVGGVESTVLFSGLAPGFVGLYQINIQLANETPFGQALPILLTVGEIRSNQPALAVGLVGGGPFAQTYRIETVAGFYSIGDGGPATAAFLTFPVDVALDRSGNLYVADRGQHRIRRIVPTGEITTVAGNGFIGFSGDGGPATSAQLSTPDGVAVDSAGNLYIADSGNQRIRRVDLNGIITTVAGNGTAGSSGDGGLAVAAQLSLDGDHTGLVVDAAGNLYFSDSRNHRVRRVSDGTITTYAGSGAFGFSGDGGPALQAALALPLGLALDAAGNLYIADTGNHRIRRVNTARVITTVAGSGSPACAGDGRPAIAARLSSPRDVAVDSAGNLYIADLCNRIREVSGGTINTVAGQLNVPSGLALDIAGNLYIADLLNGRVVTLQGGSLRVISGASHFGGDGGPATSALLYLPYDVTVDSPGDLYVADTFNHRVRRVTPAGVIGTVAGTGAFGFSGDGGQASSAQLQSPQKVLLDSSGNLYISDTGNNRVRRVTPAGVISTVAGTGVAGFGGDGGPATAAQLNYPVGLGLDASGNLYISDTGNNRVRRVTAAGVISTVVGTGEPGFSGDGGLATSARLSRPLGIAVDTSGSLWIADSSNNRVRVVGRDGFIRTVSGSGNTMDLSVPFAIAFDPVGNALITDLRNYRIRRLEANGALTTIAGTGSPGFSGDGGPATAALLYAPLGISVDRSGRIFFTDYLNHRVRRLSPDGPRIASDGVVGAGLTVPAVRAMRSQSPELPDSLKDKRVLRLSSAKVAPGNTSRRSKQASTLFHPASPLSGTP